MNDTLKIIYKEKLNGITFTSFKFRRKKLEFSTRGEKVGGQ